MSEQFRVRQPPLSSQIISGFVHVGCVPVDNRGEDEVQRHDAFLLSGVGTVLNAALRMREYGPGQGVTGFAFVEACLTLHPESGVFDPVQHKERAFDPADLAEREIQAVLLSVGAQFAQHGRGLYGHGCDTGRHPQHVAPVVEHHILIDRFPHDGSEPFPLARLAETCETAIRKIPQAWREGQAQEMEQCEDMIGNAAGIDVMHQRIELSRIAHKPVQDERCLSGGGADHTGMKRPVLPRKEGIDFQARVKPIFGVDLS